MDTNQLLERFSPFIKRNLFSITLGLFGLIFLGYGVIVLIAGGKSASDEIIFESGKEQAASSNASQIIVDIGGGVLRPGVYNLSYGARLQDAVVASGGLSESADRAWVSKNLNLALKLTDGAKIYVPKIGESITGETGITSITGSITNAKININKASIKELDTLIGIGVVTAQKIIDGRPYDAVDELLSKKIVNTGVFEKIKEKITVY